MRVPGIQYISIIILLWMFWGSVAEYVYATAATKSSERPITEDPSVADQDIPQKTQQASENEHSFFPELPGQEFPVWTFEWPVEQPLAPEAHSKSLKPALLTITLNPQQLDTDSDLMGDHDLSEQGRTLSAQAKITFELEVPENYTQEEIMEMFAATAKQLPLFDQELQNIPGVHVEVKTAPSSPPLSSMGMVFAVILLIILTTASVLVAYSRWYKKKDLSHAPSMTVQPQAKTEQELQDTRMALIGRMTSTVIHDVKNAFTAIQSCAEVMADEKLDPLERKDFAQLIVSEIERGVDMTQELMEFVRGQARTLHIEIYPANALVHDVLNVLKRSLSARSIEIRTDLRYVDELRIDVEKMRRVFMNILTNARDAMPDGGTLTITSRQVEAGVQFEVIDTGRGMSAEVQARIFEPLFTEGKSNGTGLGMMIVKEILDAHQTRIEVESEVGRGTTIRLVLPQASHPIEKRTGRI